MGLRFHKRVGLGRFVRLNVSGSGVSLGLGPPGLNVNIGRRGIRKTVGVPGTGLSYETTSSWKAMEGDPTTSTSGRPQARRWAYLVIAALCLAAILYVIARPV